MADEQTVTTGNLHRLRQQDTNAQPIPRPIRFPSDYGLANAITSLIRDYGRIGAVNRLIEAAQCVEAGRNHMWVVSGTRRYELSLDEMKQVAGLNGKR